MAWLADLAGKAEDFLNKVDQTAAVALQKDEKQRSASYDTHFSVVESQNVEKGKIIKSESRFLTNSPHKISRRGNPRKERASWTQMANKSRNDEEKLFEFLNSDSTNTKISSSSSSSSSPQKKSTTIEVDDNLLLPYDSNISNVTQNENVEADGRLTNDSLEMENKFLRNEMVSLNEEIVQLLQRVKEKESQLQQMKENVTSCDKENDKTVEELRCRLVDVDEALAAKDSQLAVLRVRLQEADEELKQKKECFEKLANERERILNDQSSANGLHSQTLQSLRDRLEENENALVKERNNSKMIQNECNQRTLKLEDEIRQISWSLTQFQQVLSAEKERNVELSNQLKNNKTNLDSCRQELLDYKQKAQKILQSKEKLISTLKTAGTTSESEEKSDVASIVASAELEESKQERETLREELVRANGANEKLRTDIQDLEIQMENEHALAEERQKSLEEQLTNEKKLKEDVIQENVNVNEEIQYMKEELCRQKSMFQSRIQDRDNELEKLRNQLTMKLMNNNQTELESRLHSLTESLIQKQTMLEALSTEKNSLVMQYERLERQMKEKQSIARRGNVAAVTVNDETQPVRVAEFLMENPFDGHVTRRMKSAYNSVDNFSVRLGIFLRRYPMARIMVIIYMGLLHLFVMIILLTYSPEVHNNNIN